MHVEQTAQQVTDSLWKWSVWLEGTDAELDDVVRVVYHLHSSFPNPIVEKSDRANAFRLNASGWGTFVIRLEVMHKDGHVEAMRHRLRFSRSESRIFVSAASSKQDQDAVADIKKLADVLGLTVSSAGDATAGEDVSSRIQSEIDRAKAVVVVSGSTPSRWVMQEVDMARALGKPLFVVGTSDVYGIKDTDKDALTVETVSELGPYIAKLPG